MMGNRGRLHDEEGRLRRPWQVKRWLLCRLEFNADFRGRENNQSSGGRNPWFLGDFVISGPRRLIVFSAQSGPIGFVSAFSML
jgi:hypothetical protein